mgnify:CR=1 FL=1
MLREGRKERQVRLSYFFILMKHNKLTPLVIITSTHTYTKTNIKIDINIITHKINKSESKTNERR